MKKSLLLLIFLLMSGSVVKAVDWIPVDTNDSTFYLYVDTDSIKNVSPQEYLYAIKFQKGDGYEKVAYIKSNFKNNYVGIIKSEVFNEDNYRPRVVFANAHVYMKPVDSDSFLVLAHNYVSGLYTQENNNLSEVKQDAFTPENIESETPVVQQSETASKPEIRGINSNAEESKETIQKVSAKETNESQNQIQPKNSQVQSNAKDLNAYVLEISSKLEKNWQPPKSGQNTQAVIILTIGKDGSLQKYDIAKSSGDNATDRSIISAAEKCVPYEKFSEIKKGADNVKLQFVFEYKKFKKSVM